MLSPIVTDVAGLIAREPPNLEPMTSDGFTGVPATGFTGVPVTSCATDEK